MWLKFSYSERAKRFDFDTYKKLHESHYKALPPKGREQVIIADWEELTGQKYAVKKPNKRSRKDRPSEDLS